MLRGGYTSGSGLPIIRMDQKVMERRILTKESLVKGPSLDSCSKTWATLVKALEDPNYADGISEENKDSFVSDLMACKLEMRFDFKLTP